MRIEFLREWMKYRIGDTTEDVAPGVADVLFMRRIARAAPVVADASPISIAPLASEPDTAKIGFRKKTVATK